MGDSVPALDIFCPLLVPLMPDSGSEVRDQKAIRSSYRVPNPPGTGLKGIHSCTHHRRHVEGATRLRIRMPNGWGV